VFKAKLFEGSWRTGWSRAIFRHKKAERSRRGWAAALFW